MTPRRNRPTTRLAVTALEDRVVPVGSLSEQIIVDQIGYRADSAKVVVFADPVTGQNGSIAYTPGANFQLRRAGDHTVAFTGPVVQWNGGATHAPSGDRAWHGDFSAVTAPGEYYVYDPATDKRSFTFEIGVGALNDVLPVAGRTFFYQRSGTAKPAVHAGVWSHAASHLQDAQSQLMVGSTPQGPATARNLAGGWWDAGDYNKYVPFTTGVMWNLLSAYEWNPAAFSDGWNVPESGNGVPDLLDEVKWELDWLLKMQLPNGSVINRIAQATYNVGNGPTEDTQPRYHTAATTWATASFAASTAHAARVLAPFLPAYSATLQTAAVNAWNYLAATPAMTPANGTDGANLAAAPSGSDANGDRRVRVLAAAELYRLTGSATYKGYFEANYNTSGTGENGHHPILNNRFDPSVATDLNRALVTYALTPGANATIGSQIRTALKNHFDWVILAEQNSDPYRGFMWDGHYTWGSNQLKANWANLLTYAVQLNVGTAADRANYRRVAEEYLHYFHGRNPLAWTYLTNAASFGGDKSPMQAYHGWWPDGSPLYDGAASAHGPTPGYVVGGANGFFSRAWVAPPAGQPPMKAFKDFNTVWNAAQQDTENSWEVNEPAIYYQAAYLLLLSQYAEGPASAPPPVVVPSPPAPPPPVPDAPTGLTARPVAGGRVVLTWTDASDDETGFVVERATDPRFTRNVVTATAAADATSFTATGLAAGTTYYFRVRAVNDNGPSADSNAAAARTFNRPWWRRDRSDWAAAAAQAVRRAEEPARPAERAAERTGDAGGWQASPF